MVRSILKFAVVALALLSLGNALKVVETQRVQAARPPPGLGVSGANNDKDTSKYPNPPCTQYSLPVDADNSGFGNIWEYYHFMIDFAPTVYYYTRNDTAPCKTLYVPGWHPRGKFRLTMPNSNRTMQDKFDFFLGSLNLTLELVSNSKHMRERITGSRVIPYGRGTPSVWLVPGYGNTPEFIWSNQSAIVYTTFRDHARALLHTKPITQDVIAVERKPSGNHNLFTATGGDRRHLEVAFYDALLNDTASHGLDTSVVSLDNSTSEEQVALFSKVSVIIAQHGAALSNMIFADPRTLVVEIGHRSFPCYERLAEKLGLHYLHYEGTSYPDNLGDTIEKSLYDISKVISYFVDAGKEFRLSRARFFAIPCPEHFTCSGPTFVKAQGVH